MESPGLIELARLPTPVHPLRRLSAEVGAELWVKRDDLTGFGLSGNKVRKLVRLLAEALEQGADTVITCGGLQSNHCRATAIACRQLGLEPVLLLRGLSEARGRRANLLLDHLMGATLHSCTAQEYSEARDERMEQLATALRAQGRRPYIVPEGGSNLLGALAFRDAVGELQQDFDRVVVAVGSGGTLAGLAMAPLNEVVGIAVCDDAPTFEARVRAIAGDTPLQARRWWVDDRYKGPAYGVATPAIWASIRLAARLEGLLTDPCYTGKALHAVLEECRKGAYLGRTLFWHTGGAFALFDEAGEAECSG